jgi:hypothetical protein
MIAPSETLTRRIVFRYLSRQTSDGRSPGRQGFVWKQPLSKTHIPDDIVLQCSSGCTLTAMEVEQMLPKRVNVVPGSCRIDRVRADAQTNRTRFEVKTMDGKRVTGTITVCMLASEQRVDAFSVVDVD